MKWLVILLTGVFISFAFVKDVNAQLTHETIDDIQVPTRVTIGTQTEWQGHIVYSVDDLGTSYRVKVARDSEPHQYPYFYISLSKSWEYLGEGRRVDPAAERRAQEAARQAEEERQREEEEREEQEAEREAERERREEARRRAEERREEREPPVVRPPEEEVEDPEEENEGE